MSDLEKDSSGELVRRAVSQVRDLLNVELELAKREAARQAKQLALGVAGFAVAVGLLSAAVAMGIVALFLALGPGVAVAGAIAGALVVLALAVAALSAKLLPSKPMGRTAARVEHTVQEVKEAIAS